MKVKRREDLSRVPRVPRDERGATLILALIFIVSIGLIVGALSDWAMNDLNNSVKFKSASSLDYATTGVVELGIQNIRYTPLYSDAQGTSPTCDNTVTNAPCQGYCWKPSSGFVSMLSNLNGFNVAVWCSTVEQLNSPITRTVTFIACKTTLTSGSSSAAVQAAAGSCALSPLLEAQVQYDDYPPGGSAPLTATCTTTCGQSAATSLWKWLG